MTTRQTAGGVSAAGTNCLIMDEMPVRVEPDYRIFALFAALNHYGYDLEGDPRMGPVRITVRDWLARQPDAGRDGEREWWMRWARPFWPRVSLMEVYALHQRDWPESEPECFGAGDPRSFTVWLDRNRLEMPVKLPPRFTSALSRLGPLLDAFAGRTGLARAWELHHAAHEDRGGVAAAAVQVALRRCSRLLALQGWPFSEVRVITNLLQSRWLADQVLIDGCLHAVIAAPDPGLAHSVVHEAVHLVIRPVVKDLWPLFEAWSSRQGGETLRRKMEPSGYWGETPASGMYRAVQEALVRAVTIASAAEPTEAAALERVMASARKEGGRGFGLVPPLVLFLLTRDRLPLTAAELAPVLAGALEQDV